MTRLGQAAQGVTGGHKARSRGCRGRAPHIGRSAEQAGGQRRVGEQADISFLEDGSSDSMPRAKVEYSNCRSVIRMHDVTRRVVLASEPDRPNCLTLPAPGELLMTPTTSSIGRFGSRNCCRAETCLQD